MSECHNDNRSCTVSIGKHAHGSTLAALLSAAPAGTKLGDQTSILVWLFRYDMPIVCYPDLLLPSSAKSLLVGSSMQCMLASANRFWGEIAVLPARPGTSFRPDGGSGCSASCSVDNTYLRSRAPLPVGAVAIFGYTTPASGHGLREVCTSLSSLSKSGAERDV